MKRFALTFMLIILLSVKLFSQKDEFLLFLYTGPSDSYVPGIAFYYEKVVSIPEFYDKWYLSYNDYTIAEKKFNYIKELVVYNNDTSRIVNDIPEEMVDHSFIIHYGNGYDVKEVCSFRSLSDAIYYLNLLTKYMETINVDKSLIKKFNIFVAELKAYYLTPKR